MLVYSHTQYKPDANIATQRFWRYATLLLRITTTVF